jgi:type VI secretion system protein ImpA
MNLDTLLSPIGPDAPCGEDLSFSPEFDRIAELRRADDPSLKQGAWVRDLKSADFLAVRALCAELLATRTKDLRLAGWLADAQARIDGFAGLAQGLELCAALCEQYWEGLQPRADEGDFEQRLGNLSWLLQQVVEAAQTVPLLQGTAMRCGRRLIESVRSRKTAGDPASGPTDESIAQALAQTPAAHLLALPDALALSLAALARLQASVDSRISDGPAFMPAREALQDTLHLARRLIRERGLAEPGSALTTMPVDTADNMGISPAAAVTASNGPLQNRAQALAQLREVAAFFRRTEPHSPVAYLADKAAHWGDLPLHLWLRAVLKDQAMLSQLDDLLGVVPPKQE